MLFERRVTAAKAAREEAESELRLFFYIDSLALVEVLHTYNYAAALEKAASQVGKRCRSCWGVGCSSCKAVKRIEADFGTTRD